MKTILIGDIGSTNAQWAWLASDRKITFKTAGFNPVYHDVSLLEEMFIAVRDHLPGSIDDIYYYGTGVISDATRELIHRGCRNVLADATITCESDMLGAARALSAGKDGIIGILGTGSNSCLFDGQRIVKQIPSLGFPLGDEGSGADIGKACARAFYYGLMPDDVMASFAANLPDDRAVFLDQFHHHKAANKYLAELVPIAARHLDSEFIRVLLQERFRTFARLHLTPYAKSCPVHIAGGVAYAFRTLLRNALEQENLLPGIIIKNPLSGLIDFHQNITHE